MNELISWSLVFFAGGMLGTFFFGGLWLTVRKGLKSRNPALWFLLSILIRTTITLSGFYLIMEGGHWERLLIGLAGFIAAKIIVSRITRLSLTNQESISKEDGNDH